MTPVECDGFRRYINVYSYRRLSMNVRQVVSTAGAVIAIYVIVSSIFHIIGYNMRLLVWVDQWGPVAGWAIRMLLVVIGGVMYYIGRKTE
jgi:hypothetical protein